MENQNLAGTDELTKLMEDLGSDEEIPSPISAIDDGSASDEDKKRAAHAYAELKRKGKVAAQAAMDERKKREDLEKKLAERQHVVPANAGGSGADLILNRLVSRAKDNLGLAVISNEHEQELVRMEVNRLYSQEATMVEDARRLEREAPEMIVTSLSSFGDSLDDKDREAITKRLMESHTIHDRVKKDVIRREVTSYIGEKQLARSSTDDHTPAGGDDLGEEETADDGNGASARSASAVAAASGIRSQGRQGQGVRLGQGSRPPGEVKPATPDESEAMSRIGVTDVKTFREAQRMKGKYKIGR